MVRHDSGFRKSDEAYFDWVHSASMTEKQVSPFIVLINKDTHAVTNLDRLLTYPPSTNVLQAWPGKWRTDVFSFRLIELIEWRKEHIL